ncbi:MAG: hypothetical protein SGI72_13690 [Planctomycetota bacterium]|nr:hypothetical protein [Planctomycetota bacterium]
MIGSRTLRLALAGSIALFLGAANQQHAPPAARGRPLPLCAATPSCPWPAEPTSSAIDLTGIEGAGTNDFHQDMSGAFWNPFAPALWVCRNGGSGGSKIWKLVPNGSHSFQVGTVAGQRAEWSNFGDCEALALGTFAEPNTLFTVEEASNSIQEWDLSSATAILRRSWNLTAHVPTYAHGLGLEALTFVPDTALAASHFVDANGLARTSTMGMGSLAFVGHQNGGRVFVFDLNRVNGAFQFVGQYATGDPEVAELTFDPSLSVLYAWHGDGRNDLEVLRLGSEPAGAIRALRHVLTYDYPGNANDEGFAIQWSPGSCTGQRGAFVITDDAGSNSVRWFRQFPCGF